MGLLKRRIIEAMEPTEYELARRWIPVEERLPEDGVRVLAWDSREEYFRVAYIDSIWHMVGFDDDTPICVSHWMPLPEPPEVK